MALTVLKSATGRAAAKRFSLDAAGVIQKTDLSLFNTVQPETETLST
jgi:hypothetical protein